MKFMRPLVLAAFAFTAACGSSPSSPDGGNNNTNPGAKTLANGSMSAVIGGTQWNATAAIVPVYLAGSPATLSVSGTDNTSAVSFTIALSGTGTFATATSGLILTVTSGSSQWVAALGNNTNNTGTLTVTTLTTHNAVGTFSFTGASTDGSTKVVTTGTFNVTY